MALSFDGVEQRRRRPCRPWPEQAEVDDVAALVAADMLSGKDLPVAMMPSAEMSGSSSSMASCFLHAWASNSWATATCASHLVASCCAPCC